MIGKTVKAVIGDPTTPFYISMEDGSVYEVSQTRDQYEKDRYWIDYEEVQDTSKLDLHYQLDLGIINDDQYEQLIKEQELKRDRENKDRKDKLKKFKTLVDELEMSLDDDAMKLLRDCKDLL